MITNYMSMAVSQMEKEAKIGLPAGALNAVREAVGSGAGKGMANAVRSSAIPWGAESANIERLAGRPAVAVRQVLSEAAPAMSSNDADEFIPMAIE